MNEEEREVGAQSLDYSISHPEAASKGRKKT